MRGSTARTLERLSNCALPIRVCADDVAVQTSPGTAATRIVCPKGHHSAYLTHGRVEADMRSVVAAMVDVVEVMAATMPTIVADGNYVFVDVDSASSQEEIRSWTSSFQPPALYVCIGRNSRAQALAGYVPDPCLFVQSSALQIRKGAYYPIATDGAMPPLAFNECLDAFMTSRSPKVRPEAFVLATCALLAEKCAVCSADKAVVDWFHTLREGTISQIAHAEAKQGWLHSSSVLIRRRYVPSNDIFQRLTVTDRTMNRFDVVLTASGTEDASTHRFPWESRLVRIGIPLSTDLLQVSDTSSPYALSLVPCCFSYVKRHRPWI